jgi:hypothetical protein
VFGPSIISSITHWRVSLLNGLGSNRVFLFSLLAIFVSSFFVYGESLSYSGGGFSIAPPPLGYTGYYGTESPKTHRVDVAYQYYDLDVSEVQGGSVYANSRIVGGSWGSASLQYGGFYLFGTDKGADNGADVDMTVSGFNLAPSLEIVLYSSSGKEERGFMLTSFFGIDGGYQFFTQDFSDGEASYHSRFAGPLGGLQAHIPAGNALISPFFSAKKLWGQSVHDDVEYDFDFTMLGYGFDIIWNGYSLSGIVQPLMEDDGTVYTLAFGFAF